MKRLGLLGKNIAHSKSKKMYEEILNEKVDYTLFDFNEASQIPSLDSFFCTVTGLSITSPYKRHFINELEITNEISSLGAINCIKKVKGKYFATNTDYLAIKSILSSLESFDTIVILGDGAMSKVTQMILSSTMKEYIIYSRRKNGDISNLDLSGIKNKSLVINTCSREFIYAGKLPMDVLFWDYNYSHEAHQKFILTDIQTYRDGLGLLKLQAEFALKFWDN